MSTKPTIATEEFDRAFDNGEEVLQHFDLSQARRPNLEPRRVTVDLPAWLVKRLDAHSAHLGISRQALIKMWIAERLE